MAVADVSFDIGLGETLAIVGESGCGKTTLSRLLLGVLAPLQGEICHHGRPWPPPGGGSSKARRKSVQAIFQNPIDSLDPRISVGRQIAEPLVIHQIGTVADRKKAVRAVAEAVRLDPRLLDKRPAELSGGECQRVAIARAVVLKPSLVVCDEPVSALDVSIQASIVELLRDLQSDFGLSYLFISHDLRLVRRIADRTAVMFAGRIVEIGKTAEVFVRPQHPYTAELLNAAGTGIEHDDLGPEPMKPGADEPVGCCFQHECPKVEEQCRISTPPLRAVSDEHKVACHLTATPNN
ncbi:oligopeptide/dipeptide ABC transporter ATP-binding protein [Ensifer aridi]|uniref:oligopeptide/dipeptide ABC transporter ATP-binding protein n=1 Tax=Ensifer aridi TaxID=1708715 RepID=UPI000A78F640|nr:oligopeptide/dipeptide ABC transporter ATP-binding protein [Ensifer aridi]